MKCYTYQCGVWWQCHISIQRTCLSAASATMGN
uniref:Uncharacterized protein n=1 Tax=Lotus japonicus TaxID=34305 RepID=I3SKP2_LOTJA|nr:unknown [Lotus japonicus]